MGNCRQCTEGCVSRLTAMKTGNIGCHTLLQDVQPLTLIQPLSESTIKGLGRVLKMGGQFQHGDVKNANGRIYPFDILEHAVKEIQKDVIARRIMGEFDHPPDAKIHLDRVSHLLTRLWMEGTIVNGEEVYTAMK